MKFLIIEDQALPMVLLTRQLQEKFPGCEIVQAENFKDGTAALQEHKDIDYLFTDYQIGDPDDATKTVRCADFIKKNWERVKIVCAKTKNTNPLKGYLFIPPCRI